MEPHSPLNLTLANKRAPWYIVMDRVRQNFWIPLTFQPPMLLFPFLAIAENLEDYDMEEEVNRWERHGETKGFY